MSMQPFQGRQKVIIEKRNADGSLDLTGEQPPARSMTFDDVYSMYFRTDPEGTGSWGNLSAWLNARGWSLRAKTW